MNKRKMIILIVIASTAMLCSCYKKVQEPSSGEISPAVTVSPSEAEAKAKPPIKLPEGITTDKVKEAFLEYINSRLWFYPAEIMGSVSDKDFDNYIGKTIEAEIRMYRSSRDNIFIYTNVGHWLALFNIYNDTSVYCDGLLTEGQSDRWPEDDKDYEVIEKCTLTVPEPRKPNYGTSELKNKKLAMFEEYIRNSCEDFYRGADRYYDEWLDLEVYIADFYEYQDGISAWLCRKDDTVVSFPAYFYERNNGLEICGVKGYSTRFVGSPSSIEGWRFMRDKADPVKYFKWNPKQ